MKATVLPARPLNTSHTIAAISNRRSLLITKAGVPMPFSPGRFLLVCWVYLLCLSTAVSPSHFIFRYIQNCKQHWISHHIKRTLVVILAPMATAFIGATMFCFSSWPGADDIEAFGWIAKRINSGRTESFLVASLDVVQNETRRSYLSRMKTNILKVVIFYLMLLLFLNVFTMIFCSRYIIREVRNGLSNRSIALQRRLYKLLLVQCLIPFFFIHTPFYVCCLAPLFRVETGIIATYLPILFAWSPALNAIIILSVVKEFRFSVRALFSKKMSAAFVITS